MGTRKMCPRDDVIAVSLHTGRKEIVNVKFVVKDQGTQKSNLYKTTETDS